MGHRSVVIRPSLHWETLSCKPDFCILTMEVSRCCCHFIRFAALLFLVQTVQSCSYSLVNATLYADALVKCMDLEENNSLLHGGKVAEIVHWDRRRPHEATHALTQFLDSMPELRGAPIDEEDSRRAYGRSKPVKLVHGRGIRSATNETELDDHDEDGMEENFDACTYFCVFKELDMVDDEGRFKKDVLEKIINQTINDEKLMKRAIAVMEMCHSKMFYVATVKDMERECDYPYMLTKCILGRLAKFCDELKREGEESKEVHADAEIFDVDEVML